jgi:hypothetical protein
MGRWWKDLDRILRGEATRPGDLKRGSIQISVGGLAVVLALLAMAYGACMGCFAVFKGGGPSYWQEVASVVKVPLLFGLTLAVTLPSLYVVNALIGSRLSVGSVVRLLAASLGVIVAVLASLGPIVAFFSASTTSYSFMILLNVAVFAASGALGLAFLLQTLHRLSDTPDLPPSTEAEELVGWEKADAPGPGAIEHADDRPLARHVRVVFRCWVVLFALVGAQMGWVLRPFIGDPARPFTWFRGRESNFFEAVWSAFRDLFL